MERVNRTLQEMITKYMYSRDTKNWLNRIYWETSWRITITIHGTIKAIPAEVWRGEIKPVKQEQKRDATPPLKVGDSVRVMKFYGIFRRRTEVKASRELVGIYNTSLYTRIRGNICRHDTGCCSDSRYVVSGWQHVVNSS